MKTLIAMTCALGIAACGRPDAPPATEPTPLETTGAYAYTDTASTRSSPSTVTAKPSVDATQNNAGVATSRIDESASTVAPATDDRKADVSSSAAPPPAEAAVVNNPGVADQTKNATNTKINDRDRHGALTPMDQGKSATERNITAVIRRGVVADKSLSFTAKNVKIITNGSKVTLRGPVKSDLERSAIETHAKQAPGVTEVDNQIEVKK
jgi:osmotically-inducible protein OsmY